MTENYNVSIILSGVNGPRVGGPSSPDHLSHIALFLNYWVV